MKKTQKKDKTYKVIIDGQMREVRDGEVIEISLDGLFDLMKQHFTTGKITIPKEQI